MARILVVEDDAHQRLLYEMELRRDGYEVDTAKDGREAVEKVKSGHYDVVVMDLKMPVMTGLDAIMEIATYDKDLPIIINTAYGGWQDDFKSWAARAYVLKSSDLTELRRHIREAVSERERGA
ncbi:MAG: response regulator [candidate division KSB1 bacterium]|nr:response regulator [candidate division KSB1 bacterium]